MSLGQLPEFQVVRPTVRYDAPEAVMPLFPPDRVAASAMTVIAAMAPVAPRHFENKVHKTCELGEHLMGCLVTARQLRHVDLASLAAIASNRANAPLHSRRYRIMWLPTLQFSPRAKLARHPTRMTEQEQIERRPRLRGNRLRVIFSNDHT